MARTALPRVTIVGAGNVGTAFALALAEAGYPVIGVISRTGKDALKLAKTLKVTRASSSIADIPPATELLVISVTDMEVPKVSREIAALKTINFKRIFAFHTSGVLSCEVLDGIKKKGAITASIHPVQTFPEGKSASYMRTRMRHTYFGIEGSPASVERSTRLVRSIGGREVVIRPEFKPLYHAACVFASSSLVVLLNAIDELHKHLETNVHWGELYGPLLTAAMENALTSGPPAAMTGPVVRMDTDAIRLHFKALHRFAPGLLPLYMTAALEVARATAGTGKLTSADVEQLKQTFRELVGSLPSPTSGRSRR